MHTEARRSHSESAQHPLSLSALVAVALASLALVQLASARTDRHTTAAVKTVQVKGGKFFFRLSTNPRTPKQG